jgi:large subunit ribosomal protein L4
MELSVFDKNGKQTSRKVNLSAEVFGIEPNDHAIYLDVKQYLANQRQGTHKAKERSEVSGSTRKIRKQKGTGGARFGSIKNIQFPGGPRAFGPRPRTYGFKLNKGVKRLARTSALSYKAKNNAITVVEDFNMEAPKTKEFISFLSSLNLNGNKTLMVVNGNNANLVLSARNLPKAAVVQAELLNTYDIMNASNLILSESCLSKIEETLKK